MNTEDKARKGVAMATVDLQREVERLRTAISCASERELKLIGMKDAALLQVGELKECAKRRGEAVFELQEQLQQKDRLISEVVAAWKEQKLSVDADVPSGDFKEDDARHKRVAMAAKRLEAALNSILPDEVKRNDGLQVGESRNLPYPKPVSDDDAKRICEHEWATMPLKRIKCYKCGEVRPGL